MASEPHDGAGALPTAKDQHDLAVGLHRTFSAPSTSRRVVVSCRRSRSWHRARRWCRSARLRSRVGPVRAGARPTPNISSIHRSPPVVAIFVATSPVSPGLRYSSDPTDKRRQLPPSGDETEISARPTWCQGVCLERRDPESTPITTRQLQKQAALVHDATCRASARVCGCDSGCRSRTGRARGRRVHPARLRGRD